MTFKIIVGCDVKQPIHLTSPSHESGNQTKDCDDVNTSFTDQTDVTILILSRASVGDTNEI